MKKIVIISYYFPPSAKAGAHRAYSMAEYLPKFGWEPIFLAPANGYFGRMPRHDKALEKKINNYSVYRIPFYYPCNNNESELYAKVVRRLWETCLFPDGKVLWNYGIKKQLKFIVKKHKPEVFFITGTPFSSFLLAPYLKTEFNLPVVLDYRDPWADNPGIEKNIVKAKIGLFMEKRSLKGADLITTASYQMIDYIKESLGIVAKEKKIFGFPYGFDGNFFKKKFLTIPPTSLQNKKSKIIGTFAGFVHGDINAKTILEGIRHAVDTNKKLAECLKINCYGTLFGYQKKPEALINKFGLGKHITLHPFLPYNEFLKVLHNSSFLILPHGKSKIANVLYPTKFFDYLGVKRPILYIGNRDGQVAESLCEINAGVCAAATPEDISKKILYISKNMDNAMWYDNDLVYNHYDRMNIFKKFSEELNLLF